MNSKQSTINRISYGVSQCSLLGPYYSRSIAMMFLIPQRIEVITLFTDMNADNNLKCVEVTLNSELGQVSDRLNANTLTSNIKKTNFDIFQPYQRKINHLANIKMIDNSIQELNPLEVLRLMVNPLEFYWTVT